MNSKESRKSFSKISKDHNNVRICIPVAVKDAMRLSAGDIVSLSVVGQTLSIERVKIIE